MTQKCSILSFSYIITLPQGLTAGTSLDGVPIVCELKTAYQTVTKKTDALKTKIETYPIAS